MENVRKINDNGNKLFLIISILTSLFLGLVTTLFPIFELSSSQIVVSESTFLYDMIYYMINKGQYINLIPIFIMFASQISIIICFILGIYKSIFIFGNLDKYDNDLDKIYYYFIISFVVLYTTEASYVVDYYSSAYSYSYAPLTFISIIVAFIARAIYESKIINNRSITIYKIIKFILLMILLIFILNSYITIIVNTQNSTISFKYHPLGYLITIISTNNNPSKTGAFNNNTNIYGSVLYYLSYLGLSITLAISLAKLFIKTSNKINIPLISITALCSTILFIVELIFSLNSFSNFKYSYTIFYTLAIIYITLDTFFYFNFKKDNLKEDYKNDL